MAAMTNEEIFEKLKDLGLKPGPVTDNTRAVYLKKLEKATREMKQNSSCVSTENMTDDQLRAALKCHQIDVGPIISMATRKIYLKKLKEVEKRKGAVEPMDVDEEWSGNADDDY